MVLLPLKWRTNDRSLAGQSPPAELTVKQKVDRIKEQLGLEAALPISPLPASRREAATYASFFVEGFDVPLYSRRSTVAKGKEEVDWGPDGDNVLFVAPFELPQPPPTLAVELMDATAGGGWDDGKKDVLIGRGVCDVGHMLACWQAERQLGFDKWTTDEWLELRDGEGNPTGKVAVRLMWQPAPEAEPEPEAEHALVRSLRRELSTLSTDQLVDRIKTEMAGTDGADAELVSEVLAAYEEETGGEA